MKFINKLLILALVWSFSACDMTDFDLQENPNEVAPENASVDDLYNNIQLEFASFFEDTWFNTAGMSRMISHTGAFDYTSATNPNNFNGLWEDVYADMIPDIDALLAIATERGLGIHAGSALVMKSYALTTLVDLFGQAPNSAITTGNFAPTADDGATVYAAADALLDQAIAQLQGNTGGPPTNDLLYAGSTAKWIKLAKTLKLRNAVTTRLVNGSAAGTINALVAEGDLISDSADDFQIQYGSTRTNPGSRHPLYYNWYENADGHYMSNYYMWLLRDDKQDADGNSVIDPRIRYYFYRQTDDAAGQDVNLYSCHFSNFPDQDAQPAHYAAIDSRLPYCVPNVEDGYFGRDHLNAEGIPPDGPVRTVYGLYPVGGQFDDNSFSGVQKQGTTGGLGEGIYPVILASYVDFLRAEAAVTLNTSDDAKALLESGIRKSMAKVKSFESLVASTMSKEIDVRGTLIPVSELYGMSDEDVDAYVAHVLAEYDATDDKLNIVMREYYIALWGNGLESYNNWRRTAKPNNMTPSLEPTAPETFIRSFFLPADHVNFNASAAQKELNVPVFWDNNPAGMAY